MNNLYNKVKIGQVFLKDNDIISNIINKIDPKYDENLIEIGSGLGSLTINIINRVKFLNAIEIDKNLSNKLIKLLNNNSKKILIFNEDARFINFRKFINNNNDNNLRIFGNLPYYASVKILINCIKYIDIIKDINVMVQKELSDKLISESKNFSRLSVILKSFFKIKLIFDNISYNSFYPKPKVKSSFINMIPIKNKIISYKDILYLDKITKFIFKNKRKKIKNKLNNIFIKKNLDILKKLNILDFNLRAEDISVNQYCKLTNFYILCIKENYY